MSKNKGAAFKRADYDKIIEDIRTLETEDRLKVALSAVNAVAAWEEANGHRPDLIRRNGDKVHQAERLLEEIVSSLPEATTYVVYGLDREIRASSREQLIRVLERKGFDYLGDETEQVHRALSI